MKNKSRKETKTTPRVGIHTSITIYLNDIIHAISVWRVTSHVQVQHTCIHDFCWKKWSNSILCFEPIISSLQISGVLVLVIIKKNGFSPLRYRIFGFGPLYFVLFLVKSFHIEIGPCNIHFSLYFEGLKSNILHITRTKSNMNQFYKD